MEEWGEKHLKPEIKTVKEFPKLRFSKLVNEKVKKLWDADTAVQRSPEWFSIRKNCITASDIGSVLPLSYQALAAYAQEFDLELEDLIKDKGYCNPYSNLNEVVLRKCNLVSGFSGNNATEWGTKYEPIAQLFYEKLHKTDLLEFGLVVDTEFPWLAASPDGITTAGIMLEIKCPLNRPITHIVPLSYWIQQQIQMQVCKFEYCDFLDCSFLEFVTRNTWLEEAKKSSDSPLRYGAIFTEMLTGKPIYPPSDLNTVDDLLAWESQMVERYKTQTPTYYVLDDYIVTRVKRSRTWFLKNKDTIKKAWDIILDVRNHGINAQMKEAQDILGQHNESLNKPKRKRTVGPPKQLKESDVFYL